MESKVSPLGTHNCGETVVEQRALEKPLAVLDNDSSPLQFILAKQRSNESPYSRRDNQLPAWTGTAYGHLQNIHVRHT